MQWPGFWSVTVFVSPKSHDHRVGEFEDFIGKRDGLSDIYLSGRSYEIDCTGTPPTLTID